MSLRQKVIQGACWTVGCALANKVVTFTGQVALAWFLVPEDFGLVALAASITSVAALLSAGGLQNVLIQRGERFRELAGQVFWLGLLLHAMAGLLVAALAPVAGLVYHEPRVVPLLLIGALCIPLAAVNFPFSARLYIDLRFRTVTAIHLGEGVLQTGIAVLLARLGFGPYAIVLPQLAVRVYGIVAFRLAAGPLDLTRPYPRQWPALLKPGLWLMVYPFLAGLPVNAAVFVLGTLHDPSETGLFAWGYQVASQAVFLLAVSLRQVLIPALVKLNPEPNRQRAAFFRATRVMLAGAVPVCLFQAVLAPYLVPLVFGERWVPAVSVVVWMSLALVAAPLDMLATALMIGKAHNATAAGVAAAQTVGVVLLTTAGAVVGDLVSVARLVALALVLGHGAAYLVATSLFRHPEPLAGPSESLVPQPAG